jgi:crotonobetainyl-CoA:carnitine CoA-transferase CaiB-like acyl-CoA transferase
MRRRRSERDGQAYPFEMINHDKASLAVDIRQSAGSAAVRRMMGHVDVVVENFRPRTLEKYELDAATARRLYPQLIYASISGYGQTGPMRAEISQEIT